ncbi:hypothetical protein GGI12_005361 [Dipsacomyces acuminosporus]|nr:hypothetical protein GGI12_005361 [Dipsacomyces acuminosporus]
MLYAEYSKYVLGDCHIGSQLQRLPFLNLHYTREVWLRFDGTLMFGSWVIEWTACALAQQYRQPQQSVESLVIVIVESPNTMTTATEDERAYTLARICHQSLAPKSISFLSQTSVSITTGSEQFGIGDKFTRLFGHFSRTSTPSCLVSIDTRKIDHSSMAWLIARNADNLRYLRIGSLRLSELQQLITGTAGELIFQGMRELLLTLNLDDSQLKQFNLTKSHFPNLEFLHVAIPANDISPQHETGLTIFEHSFLTELFFHSPGRLRVVNFPLSWDMVEILTPELLSKMQELLLYEISMENEHLLDNEESNQMLSSALSLAHLRTVCLNNSTRTTMLPVQILCSRLQTLSIPLYSLTIHQISTLAESLPLLSVLSCTLSPASGTGISINSFLSTYYHRPHYSMRSLAVQVPPSAHTLEVNRLFDLVALFPLLQHVCLPARLCSHLWERLRSDSSVQKHKWSHRLFSTVQIHAL